MYEEDDYEQDGTEVSYNGDPITVALPKDMIEVIAVRAVATVAHGLKYKVETLLDERVEEIWQESLFAKVQSMAEERIKRLATEPIQETDRYGKPVGEPKAIEDVILAGWEKHIQEKVGRDGTPSEYRDSEPRIQWLIKKFAMPDIEALAKACVEKIGNEARMQVANALGEFFAERLGRPIDTTAMILPKKK